jgi:hypothetical protein
MLSVFIVKFRVMTERAEGPRIFKYANPHLEHVLVLLAFFEKEGKPDGYLRYMHLDIEEE